MDMYQWHDEFENDSTEISYLVGTGEKKTFCTGTLGLPMLITKIHATKQISEKPNIQANEMDFTENFNENSKLVNTFLGYGTIFTLPFLNGLGEYDVEIIKHDNVYKDLEYVVTNNRLELVSYVKAEKIVINDNPVKKDIHYKHYLKDGAYYFEKWYGDENGTKHYVDGFDGGVPNAKGDRMLIAIHELQVNNIHKGKPIYADAITLIRDSDRVYAEMLNTMDLLRPIVGIPYALLGTTPRSENNKQAIVMSEYNRIFAVIPGMEKETDWKYFGGTYDPKSYIETMNIILDLVSKKCGLGARHLSYDMVEGGLKTAKEVSAAQNESFINQALINQSVSLIFESIAYGWWKLSSQENADSVVYPKIEVKMQDSIFNSQEDTNEVLDQMQMNGDLDNVQYLLQRTNLTDEEAALIINTSVSGS